MAFEELDKVELPALEQLQSLGWSYVEGAKLSPDESDERSSLKEVVLEKRLTASLKHINPWINDENLHKVVQALTKTQYANLIEANQAIWTQINQCVSVMQDLGKGNKGQTVHIIDFDNPENNEFLCTNQFKVSGPKQNIIPDIICFVNGLPIAVIECKSPYIANPMESGIDQLRRYANRRNPEDNEGAERLFHYNLMMVSTHRDKARVGTITSGMEHFLEWKDPYPSVLNKDKDLLIHRAPIEGWDYPEGALIPPSQPFTIENPSDQDVLLSGLFDPYCFLDILQNFVIFEPEGGRVLKKIPRYQQFRAVQKTIERLKEGEGSEGKSGVIWHTQGSGKSLTMVLLTQKIRRDPELKNYKLLFITDRGQLDTQLTATFQNTQGETVYHAKSVAHLRELLEKDSSDIITSTIQKFQEDADSFEFPVLNQSSKILVMADEAHRTQYGALGVAISNALPNAVRIGFTGTPLIKSQKTTSTFGSYIDTYTIEQAVQDGATVQILYEGREPLVKVTGDSLDSLFEAYFGDESDEFKQAVKDKYGREIYVLEAPKRIEHICLDIKKHYSEHIEPNGFKAMIVTGSRRAAITYKKILDGMNGPQSAVIISGDHNDSEEFTPYTNPVEHKKQIEDFKKPFGVGEGESQLSFLIVKDMLLTGFDAPIAQVMYLDRKLTDHTLLQAIARVNRTGKNKFKGYIVDYYGLSDYLVEALEMFSTEDIEGALTNIEALIPQLEVAHSNAIKHLRGMDLGDLDACIIALKNEEKRQAFKFDFYTFSKLMDSVLPNKAAMPFLEDLKLLGKINVGATNLYGDERLDVTGAGAKVRKLIEDHLYSVGIDPKIPPVDLLSQEYKEHAEGHGSSRSKAYAVEGAIRKHIEILTDEDPVYAQRLSEKLEEIIKKAEDKWDELAQLLLDFRDMIASDYEALSGEIGVTERELPFFNTLEDSLKKLHGVEELGEADTDKVREVVRSLVAEMSELAQLVNFKDNPEVIASLRKSVRRKIILEFDADVVDQLTDEFVDRFKVKFS